MTGSELGALMVKSCEDKILALVGRGEQLLALRIPIRERSPLALEKDGSGQFVFEEGDGDSIFAYSRILANKLE